MNTVRTKSELPECCKAAGDAYFLRRFPLQFGTEDPLRDHLLAIAKKWGPITKFATQGVYFRTVSREFVKDEARPYFNAEMRTLHCPQGHALQFALLGRRVYYLVWRIHMICLSFFREMAAEGASFGFSGPSDWPGPEQVEQLKIALRMYRQDTFLSNEGFEDLYKWASEAAEKLALQHLAISEMALLFVFFHELQHGMEEFHELNPDMPPAVQVSLDVEGLGRKQHEYWEREMQADANAAHMLTFAVLQAILERKPTEQDARVATHSSVAQAADLVLHSLEFVERQAHGQISVDQARLMPAFATHPPCEVRRRMLRNVFYRLVAGMSSATPFAGRSNWEWQRVERDCGAQIAVRERLYAAVEASR